MRQAVRQVMNLLSMAGLISTAIFFLSQVTIVLYTGSRDRYRGGWSRPGNRPAWR